MAKDNISINSSAIAEIKANAATLSRQIEATQKELQELQKKLNGNLSTLEQYIGMCYDQVIPIKSLQKQKDRMDGVVTLLDQATELAESANYDLSKRADQLKLIIKGIAASIMTSIISIVTKGSDVGDQKVDVDGNESNTKNNDISGSHITANKQYGVGDVWMVSAYSGDRDKSVWPVGYTGGSGCAVASMSMALSTLGMKVDPAAIMSHNSTNDPEYMLGANWSGSYYGVNEVKYPVDAKNQQAGLTSLDQALNNYLNNSGVYSAPIIGFNKPYSHFVVVLGKNEDGSYQIADPSGNYITKYKFSESDFATDKSAKTFTANLVSVRQYKK